MEILIAIALGTLVNLGVAKVTEKPLVEYHCVVQEDDSLVCKPVEPEGDD